MDYLFHNKELWLRIILWSENEEINLKQAGLNTQSADICFKGRQEEDILYLFYKNYSRKRIDPITTAMINFDLAKDPTANITCLFINFETPLIVNIYDDRGIDILCYDLDIITDISNKFRGWLN